ncbi:MAG: (2Fe-2S)-binding protein [Mucilaginibacter sp.]|nr:(2Fe-2S)-binding protein [Mucilaginibacter sp.]
MGELLRRYWIPALLVEECPSPDCPPVRVKLLGEELIAFRDTNGNIGSVDEFCPHRRVSLFFGRNEECGLRCPYHGWKFDTEGNCMDMPSEPQESNYNIVLIFTSTLPELVKNTILGTSRQDFFEVLSKNDDLLLRCDD